MRFPEFKDEWNIVKVSDLLEFYSTNSYSWDQLDFEVGEIFNLHYGMIHNGLPTMMNAKENILPFVKEKPKNYTICKEGDVAFADASEDTNEVAKCIEFTNCDRKQIICGLHTIHGRDKLGITELGYKGYAFSSKAFHDQVKKLAQGTKIYSISAKTFSECFVGIPSNKEQQKIAKLLSLIDKRIEIQRSAIEKLKSLMAGIRKYAQSLNSCKSTFLRDILTERKEKNTSLYPVYSVAVKEGIINQIEHLGRSFAAKDTANYHVVHEDDIVYTKSPTGNFPYGIVKKSFTYLPVAVSPLYGVYIPKNKDIACFLHYYFLSPANTNNYLHCLIQKGAKNTINITNQHFLDNTIDLPGSEDLHKIVKGILTIQNKIEIESNTLKCYLYQKSHLLSKMFI